MSPLSVISNDLILLGLFMVSGFFSVGRLFGNRNRWLGAILGFAIGVLLVYTWILDVPNYFLGQATYAFTNINTADYAHPVNAVALLYSCIIVYVTALAYSMLRRFAAMKIRVG